MGASWGSVLTKPLISLVSHVVRVMRDGVEGGHDAREGNIGLSERKSGMIYIISIIGKRG